MGQQNSKNMMETATILSQHNADHNMEETEDVSEPTYSKYSCTSIDDLQPATSTTTSSSSRINCHPLPNPKDETTVNGLVGEILSSKSMQLSVDFWDAHLVKLDVADQIEIGCAIFFSLISTHKKTKQFFVGKRYKLETLGPKFLDMVSYVFQSLRENDIDLYSNLRLLGALHSKQGISLRMYHQMLSAINETFEYYFADQYTTDIKHALSEVFIVVARVMNHVQQKVDVSIDYLRSLDDCLSSSDGRASLLLYLKQHDCGPIVLFYDLLNKFKQTSNCDPIQRLMVSRDIMQFAVDGLEISPKARKNILSDMQRLNDLWFKKIPFEVHCTLFHDVEREINAFIVVNYWDDFKQSLLHC